MMNEALRKAAVLISALDSRTADALLDQMGEAQAARVRAAVMELDDISRTEQDQVLREFASTRKPNRSADSDGVELDASLLRRLEHRDTAAVPTERPSAENAHRPSPPLAIEQTETQRPFAWLKNVSVDTLCKRLANERPQIIAIVMSYLPPDHAAQLLALLPAGLQADVAERLVYLESTPDDTVSAIEQSLREQLSDELDLARRRKTGIRTLESIVAAAPASQREVIVKRLAGRDRELAKQLLERSLPVRPPMNRPTSTPKVSDEARPTMSVRQPLSPPRNKSDRFDEDAFESQQDEPTFTFDQLGDLDESSLLAVLREVEPEVALLALAGAPPELMNRITRRLSPRESRMLQRQIDQIGPVRLRDIEEAQRRVAKIAGEVLESQAR